MIAELLIRRLSANVGDHVESLKAVCTRPRKEVERMAGLA